MSENKSDAEKLMTAAAKATKSEDAMRFSQAACNVANTLSILQHVKEREAAGKKP